MFCSLFPVHPLLNKHVTVFKENVRLKYLQIIVMAHKLKKQQQLHSFALWANKDVTHSGVPRIYSETYFNGQLRLF